MGSLFIVSTPIGNLEDMTIRAIKTLFRSDIILCEDTRRTGLLLDELRKRYANLFSENPESETTRKLISYYDEIEDKRIPEVIDLLEQGKSVALISDAGTPLISDPGFRLVRECSKRHIKVESIPGPSALLAALTSSGLPSDTFTFLGYLPEKESQIKKVLGNIALINKTMQSTYVFYCAPHKLLHTGDIMKELFGDIEIVIARELTKVHEEVWRGTISEAQVHFINPQGEFVILFRLS